MSDDQSAKPHKKPLPIIYPDADPDNANWLRILAQRRQEQEQAGKQPNKKQQKENTDHDDVQ